MMLFSTLNKRNTCDKAKGLRITSEWYIGSWAISYTISPMGSSTLR